MLSMIAALARHRVIGFRNRLPWHLPADLKHFRDLTLTKPVVMGRKTYASIGRPLPQRTNWVLSRDPTLRLEGADVLHSLDAVLALGETCPELMVIGGAELYAALLPQAERLYLTLVDAEFEGDAWFPAWNPADWRELARQDHAPDLRNPYPYRFVTLERR